MNTVPASIPVLRWAADRAWLSDVTLEKRFRKWLLWLSGEAQPTLRQLEDFARLTHTPIGYFFLPEPPELTLPVPDFRTVRDETLAEREARLYAIQDFNEEVDAYNNNVEDFYQHCNEIRLKLMTDFEAVVILVSDKNYNRQTLRQQKLSRYA